MKQDLSALACVFLSIVQVSRMDGQCLVIKDSASQGLDLSGISRIGELRDALRNLLAISSDYGMVDEFLALDTMEERLAGQPYISCDARLSPWGWCRISILPGADGEQEGSGCVLVCIRDINSMKLAQLKAKNDAEISHDILEKALEAARHANQAKTTFLNSMSHDIRTPMNAIIGFTSLAASHIDNKDAVVDYLKKITVSSSHLLSLINDVLDMSRIESGRTKLDEKECSLPDILHDLRSIINSNIQAKQLDFFIDTQDVTHERVVVDKLRLNQVLLNILGNAVKFTPAKGTISMRVIENQNCSSGYAEYEFHIKDNGIGMSKEYQQHIFEPFTREQTVTVSGIPGSGLGMSITKSIVDLMNGAIAVDSEIGKGTEFTVILDLKKAGKAVSQEPIPELKGMHALVADDDFNTCSSVSKMLVTIGMRPEWTTSGKEAVLRTAFAKESGDAFGAFIIDWLMPDMNGIEVVRRIRKEVGQDTPIIILTAYDWTAIEEEAREAGVTGFCAKPLFLSELREVLSRPFQPADEKAEKKEEKAVIPSFVGKRILLAEDNVLNQELAEAILTEYGFRLDIAGDGTEAVRMVMDHDAGYYDVVITDIQMPVMNGYEASRAIRSLKDPAKSGIPILALSANAFEEDKRRAIEAGMNGHLSKPINLDELVGKLRVVLDGGEHSKD